MHGKRLETLLRAKYACSAVVATHHQTWSPAPAGTAQQDSCLRPSSGALHRSVLALVLSNTFTNALEEVTEGLLISFPDDTKLERPVVMLKDRAAIQVDLDWLEEWANRDLMKFDKDECKVLCLGMEGPFAITQMVLMESKWDIGQQ